MKLKFTKMQGLGNDFVVLDGINQAIALDREQIRKLADRHFGIGCDQLLLVEKPRVRLIFAIASSMPMAEKWSNAATVRAASFAMCMIMV